MKSKKLKRLSLINLFTGYGMLFLFALLVLPNLAPEATEVAKASRDIIYADDLFKGVHEDDLKTDRFYVEGHPVDSVRVIDRTVGLDHGMGIILDDEPDVFVARDSVIDNVVVVSDPNHVVIRDRNLIERGNDLIIGDFNNETHIKGHRMGGRDDSLAVHDVHSVRDRANARHGRDLGEGFVQDTDIGLLDRRLAELKNADERDSTIKDELGINANDLSGLTLAGDNDADFEIDIEGLNAKEGGLSKGDLYAYNFPSQGIGAGIGSPAIGAGVGAAGIGAGIGEAMLDGKSVPTLGGVGTYSPAVDSPPAEGGPALAPPTMGGIGGLVSGAGAGGAAGLATGRVKESLGASVPGVCAEHGVDCSGLHGHGEGYNFDHLPADGALHIMMHVDASGSILNTRKQLDLMKDTLLKDALLPYYKNDEQLYNRRVTIVDGNGERTLQFFNTATQKDNVLALVFQDEASPAYHLPTFNKAPQHNYSDDLSRLRSNLNNHQGLYRGIMFQVDRGRTFAKSFKEFVECAWKGSGYLEKENLKKYYWEENKHHIKNKDGIVFSDVYHAKDEGVPQYYLNLIFDSARKVGVDLNIYGAGLRDGKKVYNRE
jgi:hypothetical protein